MSILSSPITSEQREIIEYVKNILTKRRNAHGEYYKYCENQPIGKISEQELHEVSAEFEEVDDILGLINWLLLGSFDKVHTYEKMLDGNINKYKIENESVVDIS
jgi:hypothetical protein